MIVYIVRIINEIPDYSKMVKDRVHITQVRRAQRSGMFYKWWGVGGVPKRIWF